ncbi:S8 family serine peptidase [Shewanella olleyana]|uniref:S8 family serine peptidase n=1 Tax=Shewanella olleyana TaxID=135626 RepID=UPI00200E9389|nr:S8 family serine peptidase [Shewanella olleyana]MCL1067533.1 S8 family serine peptidase [Shewanella olleyana]
MSFKKSKLATCIALASIMPVAAYAATQSDVLTSYSASTQQTESATLFVYLSDKGSLTKATINNKTKFAESLKQVEASQQSVINNIMALDGNIKTLPGSKLVGNFIRVQANSSYIDKIKQLPGVQAVVMEAAPIKVPTNALRTATSSNTKSVAAAPELSDDMTAGEGVKVAIIGSGVDYTHIGLGGDGSAESYATAMENSVNSFDGFPTEVVVEGMDLSSDAGWGLDPNPIDQNIYFTREYDGATHNTGHGTRLASVVHALAPAAKIAAYKTSNVSDPYGYGYNLSSESSSSFMMALEYALDPNQDGSFDDRADIIVVDALGGNAFYAEHDDGVSAPIIEAYAIEMASALGSLVVVNAGDGGDWYDNNFNMTWRGAAPSAMTVGGIKADTDGNMMVTESTPYGPVRGASGYSKPDMVSYAEEVDVAVVGGGDEMATASNTVLAVARMAAAAAIIKSKRPELSMVEVKALLMNTANNAVMDLNNQQGELTLIGSGVENVDSALASAAVAWEKDSYQPNLHFGFTEGTDTQRYMKEVQLKNLSDEAVTYQVGLNSLDKEGNKALTWEHPASISIPAGQTVVFPVTMVVDFSKLDNWPMKMGSDLTIENWQKIELSGQLQLMAEEQPTLNINWLAKPRATTAVTRHFDTYEELYGTEFTAKFSESAGAYAQQFTNDSATETTFAVFPAMHHQQHIPASKVNTQGNMLNTVAGGIYDDAMCPSGKKMVVAGHFFKPNDVGMANHFDKSGAKLVWWNTYQEQFVLDNELDKAVNGDPYPWDEASQVVMSGYIEVDENGQPHSYFTDYNKEYDWSDHYGRYTKSSLPTYVTGHGQNFVAQYCLDDLYHGDQMATVADFDQNQGWIFGTDRDAVANLGEPIILFNPVQYGKTTTTTQFDWMTGEMVEVQSKGGGLPLISRLVEEGETKDYSPMITLAAGETAELAMASECNFLFGFGAGCDNDGMLIMSLEDNWAMTSPMGQGDYSFIPHPKDGQSHTIDEDAEIGEVVAQVELDSETFFANGIYEAEWSEYSLALAKAIPGDPFSVSNTGEIIVNNPEALDYDAGNISYELEVIGNQGQVYTAVSTVTIHINNVNDIAPVMLEEMPAVTMADQQAAEIDASIYFSDVEGDVLTFSATGLPEGISIDSKTGMITGIAAAGVYDIVVTADDMVHKTEANFTMTINDPVAETEPEIEEPVTEPEIEEPVTEPEVEAPAPEPELDNDDDGGSLGFLSLTLLTLLGMRRKVKK